MNIRVVVMFRSTFVICEISNDDQRIGETYRREIWERVLVNVSDSFRLVTSCVFFSRIIKSLILFMKHESVECQHENVNVTLL